MPASAAGYLLNDNFSDDDLVPNFINLEAAVLEQLGLVDEPAAS